MAYKIDAMCMGDLIRAKEDLYKREKISDDEYDTITKYLDFLINEEA